MEGNVKKNDKNNKLLENAQRLCREGILKRLEEETKPEWNDLIMGKSSSNTFSLSTAWGMSRRAVLPTGS